ncbi:unnamed protein product [Taenia asiatica]|uniref:ANK_REP_REGION domain-containing protein n=1 Tax=Taenia asiatica TaxID=60517 RepID=A0A158R729_TAEAS|nr:unnamed protein product [Taenia asiatica]
MTVSIPNELCDYPLERSGGVAKPLVIDLKLNRNEAKKDNKLNYLELEKEPIPKITFNAVQCPGKKANQNVEVVDFLLSYGADPNALTINGMSPIIICAFAYLEKHSAGHNKGPHLVELGVGQRPSDVWSRAELVWLFGCDGSDPPASYSEEGALIIRSSDDEGYIESDVSRLPKTILFRARLKTMLLLLQHGADPNTVTQPLPPLIAAARAGDVELSRLLLRFGADPNIRVRRELTVTSKTEFTDNHGNVYEPSTGGLTALHFAVVLPGEVGVKLTQTLLQGGANPTLRALPDASFLVDIEHSLKIVQLLVDHGADLNLLCNGQSALSLALTCGNDEIASLLLTYPQTKAGMGLTHGLGSSLCVVLHPVFEHVRSFDSRLTLLSKLISHCPSGLLNHRVIMPCEVVEGNIVDYIYHAYTQVETKLLGNPAKCQILKNRHHTLNCLAAELRKTVFASELWKRNKDLSRTSSPMEMRRPFTMSKMSIGVVLLQLLSKRRLDRMARKTVYGYNGFYKDRIYMTKDAIERLLEENFSSPGNYSFL